MAGRSSVLAGALMGAVLLVGGRGAAVAQPIAPARTGLYAGAVPAFPIGAPATSCTTGRRDATYLGADAAFVCSLAPSRTKKAFWTFCDAAIGPPGARDRSEATPNASIGSTIAISDCADGTFRLTHYYRGTVAAPRPFFADPDNPTNSERPPRNTRAWPRKAIYDDATGALYVFAQQTRGSGVSNTFVYRVRDPLVAPGRWVIDSVRINHVPVASGGAVAPPARFFYGSEAQLGTDGYIYTYAFLNAENLALGFKAYPFRVPLAALRGARADAEIGPACQYRRPDGSWVGGDVDPARAEPVALDAFNGFTVRRNPLLPLDRQFQLVFEDDRQIQGIDQAEVDNTQHTYFGRPTRTGNGPDARRGRGPGRYYYPGPPAFGEVPPKFYLQRFFQVYVATGPSMYGPWGKPTRAGIFPQMVRDDGVHPKAGLPPYPYNPDVWCAWAREVPEFARDDRAVSFVYTTYSLSKMREPALATGPDPATGRPSALNDYWDHDNTIYTTYYYPTCNPLFGGCDVLPPE